MGGSDRIFGICNWGGRLLRGQIFFQELKAGDGILVFLDNNMLTKIATAQQFIKFAANVSEILENHSGSFFNQSFRKRYKTQRQSPGGVM